MASAGRPSTAGLGWDLGALRQHRSFPGLATHLSLWREQQLIAVAPLTSKAIATASSSDQSFAQLAGQLGLRYYPKLLGMSPLGPILGYRFFIASAKGARAALMVRLIDRFCERNQLLSCNFLYVDPAWRPRHGRWLLHLAESAEPLEQSGYGSFEITSPASTPTNAATSAANRPYSKRACR